MTRKTMKDMFDKYDAERSGVLDTAFENAQFTIPSLYRDRYLGSGGINNYSNNELPELYNSTAAQNVNMLASMMTNALFPPNDIPFFELKFAAGIPEEIKAEFRDAITELENTVLDSFQISNLRETLFMGLQHAEVLGDTLIYQTDLEKYKIYHLSNFIIRRDGNGIIKEIWTVDWVVTSLLDDELKNINSGKPTHQNGELEPLYTRVYLDDDTWKSDREFRNTVYEKQKTYRELPYYHMGWTRIAHENYSRSLVEENMGTIRTLEMVSKALAEGIAAGSEGRIVVNSAGPTTKDDIGDVNWSIISARPEDLSTFQPQVGSTVQTALTAVQYYENQLNQAFLSTSAADLRGERVTAFQTNQVVNERSQRIGGVLATIEQNLEMMVRRTIDVLIQNNRVVPEFRDAINNGDITIHIASGLDALSKQVDAVRIENIMQFAMQSQDEEIHDVLNKPNLLRGYARAAGLDMGQYTRTEEEVAQKRVERQSQQLNQQVNEQAAGAVIDTLAQEAQGQGSVQ